MASRRKITVSLTVAQYQTLGGAVAQAMVELENDPTRETRREAQTLERAWDAIRDAWYADS